jgi:hypothetical protein
MSRPDPQPAGEFTRHGGRGPTAGDASGLRRIVPSIGTQLHHELRARPRVRIPRLLTSRDTQNALRPGCRHQTRARWLPAAECCHRSAAPPVALDIGPPALNPGERHAGRQDRRLTLAPGRTDRTLRQASRSTTTALWSESLSSNRTALAEPGPCTSSTLRRGPSVPGSASRPSQADVRPESRNPS